MFHQANVIATNLSGGSLLAYWYQEVMDLFSTFIAFPVTVRQPRVWSVANCFIFFFFVVVSRPVRQSGRDRQAHDDAMHAAKNVPSFISPPFWCFPP